MFRGVTHLVPDSIEFREVSGVIGLGPGSPLIPENNGLMFDRMEDPSLVKISTFSGPYRDDEKIGNSPRLISMMSGVSGLHSVSTAHDLQAIIHRLCLTRV
jgi:hypothetical protein